MYYSKKIKRRGKNENRICSFYKNKKDNKLYIPLIHNNDTKVVLCAKVYINIVNNNEYYHLFDEYSIKYKKLFSIDIEQLEGPVRNQEGVELAIPKNNQNSVYHKIWEHKINALKNTFNRSYRGESIKFIDWCTHKYVLESNKKVSKSILDSNNEIIVKNKSIYWAHFGHNIGNEIRKERPVIIWKKFKDSNRYFVIPLTTKDKNSNSYIYVKSIGKYAALEHMKLVSVKRISRPFFDEHRNIQSIGSDEVELLKSAISKFLNLV